MNKIDLNNRTAIVTGGAQGFGLAITKRFLESGAEVIIWDIDKASIDNTMQTLKGKKISFQIVDVSNYDNILKNIDLITKDKKIDIFINNAGVAGNNEKVWEYPNEEWHRVVNLNLNSVFFCCKSIVPHMIKNNYGRIINVSSVAGKEGNPNACAYSSAKAAVIAFTKSLGKELAEKNIAVNCITPAAGKTKILEQSTTAHVNYMLSKIPRNRLLEVNELASMVAWLACEENSYATAATFDLSGGRATY
jgi:NAD(P)-dependent dehydrogenase (short-subunit alcohol dehydrogenase family)|tara:strand:+ start:266 stop:1012 length:747 start_codon:yes stop_codon:yes gene_type:complete